MLPFTFVHAADLHLDAPFAGLSASFRQGAGDALARIIERASLTALERLVELCISAEADFLLLAGDVYNAAEGSLRARLALRDAFVRLEARGIGVFMAHGNHDPCKSEEGALPWPANVRVFGRELESLPAYGARSGRDGGEGAAPVALIHGISHASARESGNLARLFKRRPASLLEPEMFQIGLLHCAVAGISGGHEAYAPCSASDLAGAELDYWALGHVHACRFLDRQGGAGAEPPPHILAAYPGSLQGLHVNEAGPHGCLVGRVGENSRLSLRFVPLAPIQWEQLPLEARPDIADIPSLEEKLLGELGRLAGGGEAFAGADGACPPKAVLVRSVVSGRSALDGELRVPGAAEALKEHLDAELAGSGVWLRELVLRTRPLLDAQAVAERTDLAGEILRASVALAGDEQALRLAGEEALGSLFGLPRARKSLRAPEAEELAELVEEAAFVCLDMLGLDGMGDEEDGGEAFSGGEA